MSNKMAYVQYDEHLKGGLIPTGVAPAVMTFNEKEGMLRVGPDNFFDEP
jgi:hypothetical protein